VGDLNQGGEKDLTKKKREERGFGPNAGGVGGGKIAPSLGVSKNRARPGHGEKSRTKLGPIPNRKQTSAPANGKKTWSQEEFGRGGLSMPLGKRGYDYQRRKTKGTCDGGPHMLIRPRAKDLPRGGGRSLVQTVRVTALRKAEGTAFLEGC